MRRREWQWAVALAVFMAATLCTAQTTEKTTAKESEAEFLNRTAWWREAKFGMFIHWGLYAVPADSTDLQGKKGAGEWYMSNKQVQVKDYEKLAAHFNPLKFDAKTWIKTAKQTGMKYLIITTKHHDGFCLYDTRLTDYCVTKATPWKHDPMKDLAAECRSQGIKLCFYYSIMDWHHPDYLPRRGWDKRPVDGANLDCYVSGGEDGSIVAGPVGTTPPRLDGGEQGIMTCGAAGKSPEFAVQPDRE
jgi:alpha-L-fucosidase